MKFQFLSVAVALMASSVSAECPNHCSLKGRCTNYKMLLSTATASVASIQLPAEAGTVSAYGYDTSVVKKDSCTCFSRIEDGSSVYSYTGADCSLKTCPHGKSFSGAAIGANSHDVQAECSNQGLCDRSTGQCKCFPGYTGKGCRRTVCPNDCNGRGKCKSLKEIAKLRSENTAWAPLVAEFDYTKIVYSSAWDADKMHGCECDAGFKGADCSERECPTKADPMGGEGNEAGRQCSGRGTCNHETGECACFEGFRGHACEKMQMAYV